MSEQQNETPAPSALDGWDSVQLVGRFLPDPNVGPFENINQAQAAGYDTLEPYTGSYQVAVVVDDVPVVILEEQAAHVRHLIGAAKVALDKRTASK